MMTVDAPPAAARLDLAATTHTPTPRAVAIGVFDGVHLGHRHLLSRLRRLAHGCGAQPRGADVPSKLGTRHGFTVEPVHLDHVPVDGEPTRVSSTSYHARVRTRGEVGVVGPVTVAGDATLTAWSVPSSAASASATVQFWSSRPGVLARR